MDGLETTRRIKQDHLLHKQPAIVLVTAFGREEAREEAEKLGIEGFLVKPVTMSTLVDTLVMLFAPPSLEATQAAATDPHAGRLKGARILLAEDNEINQQIAVELLESVGAHLTVANNGQEAVARLLQSPAGFDLVLMDLQMPVMGGYEAAQKVRADARFARLPVIAMTAHATIEEKQKCLAAGMNDHISKPIDPAALFDTVGRFYKQPDAATPATGVRPSPGAAMLKSSSASVKVDLSSTAAPGDGRTPDSIPDIAGLDTKDGLTRLAGNRKLYLKLLRQFIEQQGPAVAQITAALAAGDAVLAERLAHTLKGVAGNIGAKSVQSAAGSLEKLIGKQANSDEMMFAKQALASELNPLVAALQTRLGSDESQTSVPASLPAADPAQSREAAAQLIKLFGEFDPGAVDFIENNQNLLRPLFNVESWEELKKRAAAYSFQDANTLLEQALQKCAT